MAEDFSSIWETLELEETIRIDETIVSKDARDWRDTLRSSLPFLPLGQGQDSQFEVAEEIGRGGMGVVHRAKQRSLSREVAIKTVTEKGVSRESENALLQEARVMGIVEHPNVVPVHIIGQDDHGRPIIVMKRIEGVRWADYADRKIEVEEDDPIEFHLDIARSVCRALSFAHDRGILHRDIKPENVMIGRFGEVYLLDWGLAVALSDDVGRLPLARESREVVGTPAFMAPEMTNGDAERLGPHTDVFLVGATIYHAITGAPPNRGDTVFEVLSFAYSGTPRQYPVDTPAELRDLCEKAMAHRPADRFANPEELREAIDSFLSHRSSHLLVEDARKRLFALRDAMVEEDPEEVQTVFGEARFGFVSALRIWDQNRDAIDGLQATLTAMIEWELSQKNVPGARGLLTQLPETDPELEREIEEVASQLAEEEAKLKKIAYDYDENIGITERSWTIGAMGGLMLISPIIKWTLVDDWTVPPSLTFISSDPVVLVANVFGLTFLPILAFIIYVTATRYADHKSSRIFTTGLFVMYVFGMGARTSSLWADAPLWLAMTGELAIFAVGLFSLGLSIDRRLGRAAFVITVTIVLLLAVPRFAVEIYCFGMGASCLSFALYRGSVSVLPWADA